MFGKYLIKCLLSALLFNHLTASILDSNSFGRVDNRKDNEINSDEMSLDDKLFDLQDNIIQKMESLGRIEDLISKGNKETADYKNNLAAMENKLPDLEEKIKKILDIVEKIPESIEKINQRLDELEKAPKLKDQLKSLKEFGEKVPILLESFAPKMDSLGKWSLETRSYTEQTLKAIRQINDKLEALDKKPETSSSRAVRNTSTKSDGDLKELENMVDNLEKDYIANNKLYNEELFRKEILDVDDVDKLLIEDSGCKYLSLKNEDLQAFQIDNDTMSLVTVAYDQLSTYRHIRRADFESHFSVRSTGDVYILLWEVEVHLNPDYKIGLGVKEGSNRVSSLKLKNGEFWKETTPNILTPDEYKKFYIKAYEGSVEFGSNCDAPPLHVHNTRRNGTIVAIGFLSKSSDEVKILLDCPATSCAD